MLPFLDSKYGMEPHRNFWMHYCYQRWKWWGWITLDEGEKNPTLLSVRIAGQTHGGEGT